MGLLALVGFAVIDLAAAVATIPPFVLLQFGIRTSFMACTGTVLGAIWPLSLLEDIWAWLAAKHFGSKRKISLPPGTPPFLFYYAHLFTMPEEINAQTRLKSIMNL